MTNSGLEYVKNLSQLIKLRRGGTQVSDLGLRHLEGLTNLGEIDLTDTKVAAAGVERLRHSLLSDHREDRYLLRLSLASSRR